MNSGTLYVFQTAWLPVALLLLRSHGSLESLYSLTLHTHSRAGKPERWTRRCFSPHLYTYVLCMEPSVPVSRGGLTSGLWHKPPGSVCETSLPPSVPHVSHLDAEQTKCGRGDSRLLLWNSSLLGCEHTGFPIGFFLDVFLSLADNLAHCWGSVPMFWTNE